MHVCLRFLAEEMTFLISSCTTGLYARVDVYICTILYIYILYMMHACVFTVFSGRDGFSLISPALQDVCTRVRVRVRARKQAGVGR